MEKKDRQMHIKGKKLVCILGMFILCILIISGVNASSDTSESNTLKAMNLAFDDSSTNSNAEKNYGEESSTLSESKGKDIVYIIVCNLTYIFNGIAFGFSVCLYLTFMYYIKYRFISSLLICGSTIMAIISIHMLFRDKNRSIWNIALWGTGGILFIETVISLIGFFYFIVQNGLDVLELLHMTSLFCGILTASFIFYLSAGLYKSIDVEKRKWINFTLFYIFSIAFIALSGFSILAQLFMSSLLYNQIIGNSLFYIFSLLLVGIIFLYEQKSINKTKTFTKVLIGIVEVMFLLMLGLYSICSIMYRNEPLFPGIESYIESFINYLKSIIIIKPITSIFSSTEVVNV